MTPHGADVLQAADRIEELIEESGRRLALARSEGVARVEQFERNEALTEQLAAAQQDAKEAEAYAEELEQELNTCRMAQAVMDNTVADLEAKLAKAVEAAEEMSAAFYSDGNVTERHLRACKAGVKLDATLAEIKGENHD